MTILRSLLYRVFHIWVWRPEETNEAREVLYLSKAGFQWLPFEGRYEGRKTLVVLIEEERA